MPDEVRPFRVAFPELRMSDNYGGERAIVVYVLSRPADPNMGFATCVDIKGRVHPNVPISMAELRTASLSPLRMIEVKGEGENNMPRLASATGLLLP